VRTIHPLLNLRRDLLLGIKKSILSNVALFAEKYSMLDLILLMLPFVLDLVHTKVDPKTVDMKKGINPIGLVNLTAKKLREKSV